MAAPKSSPTKSSSKMHRRSRSGCFTCRLRRKKCDEAKPKCKACKHLGLTCDYKRPMWWSNNEQRRKQKDDIKNIIKKTKLNEKSTSAPGQGPRPHHPGYLHRMPTTDSYDSIGRETRASSVDSQESLDYDDFGNAYPATPGVYDPYSHHMYTSHFAPPAYHPHSYPYEVDIRTERQMFVNDVPTRRDSSISTFSTFQPPPPHSTLPSYSGEDWVQADIYESRRDSWSGEEGLDFNFFDFSHGPAPHTAQQATIPVDDCDRRLLDHFINKVLKLIFPVLEVNQHGSAKAEVILPALGTNKCYLHCCLSVAAIHLKATERLPTEQIDNDIMRHRYETVSELCKALNDDTGHLQILDATLAMIFFQCAVGRPDDCLPDIPWHQHFQAATSLVNKLDLPRILEEMPQTGVHPPFNMTLTSWIDILGATMLGRSPTFAHTYRTKHLTGSTSGLCELMGCEDRVMYLLSEIACLDALRLENKVDDIAVCTHITLLAKQLDATQGHNDHLTTVYSNTGAIRPRQLSKVMTALYRIAARVYLCSLVPGNHRYDQSNINLIADFADTMQFIPSGPDGFDRSLVWPLLICGSFSIPTSPIRRVIEDRVQRLGEQAEFGSFGRMIRLIREVWRRADHVAIPSTNCEPTPISAEGISTPPPETTNSTTNTNTAQIQNVHWRDVMRENCWGDFILI